VWGYVALGKGGLADVGYGTKVQRRSKRFVPYEADNKRTYRNIVPARSKVEVHPLPTPVGTITTTKRTRSEDEVPHPGLFPAQLWDSQQLRQVIPETTYRGNVTPRIPISSLLTIDQAIIAGFVEEQALHFYTPNYYHTSPLRDPILFNVFKHYVQIVAPTMSLIESSPPNPTILNHHVNPNMKACNLFTYQLPIMAISGNWVIMEVILAIGFLHQSHLTRSSKERAFMHYQLALKRLRIQSSKLNAARDLGLLAATLLLAWYELTTGDHVPPSVRLAK
jgi:Fungal specific transcription factor domain